MITKIEKVMEEKVRPQLMHHEGNVEIREFTEEGILKIQLTGRCAGCPSARITTEEVIGKTIMEEIKEVKDVVLINEINPELLDFAKMILSQHR